MLVLFFSIIFSTLHSFEICNGQFQLRMKDIPDFNEIKIFFSSNEISTVGFQIKSKKKLLHYDFLRQLFKLEDTVNLKTFEKQKDLYFFDSSYDTIPENINWVYVVLDDKYIFFFKCIAINDCDEETITLIFDDNEAIKLYEFYEE